MKKFLLGLLVFSSILVAAPSDARQVPVSINPGESYENEVVNLYPLLEVKDINADGALYIHKYPWARDGKIGLIVEKKTGLIFSAMFVPKPELTKSLLVKNLGMPEKITTIDGHPALAYPKESLMVVYQGETVLLLIFLPVSVPELDDQEKVRDI